ncbi:hypothetical protein AB0O07_24330 [Streptomyces sp. NPDC093085]|uniref:hypothetical protein n=1 Tax=Streptomyces sp. NPDC093085 TaxID=3155068 RepID=UPI003416921C
MSRRTPLPPPPPPAHLRSWPDRAALLADRALALAHLGGRVLGPAALAAYWLLTLGVEAGWALIALVLKAFVDGTDDAMALMSLPLAGIGLATLLTAGIFLAESVGRARRVRALMAEWAALDSDPGADAGLRMPARSLSWLLTSFVAGAAGLGVALVVPATAVRGEDTYTDVAYAMVAGTVLWIAGLAGVTRAVAHYRWALRLRPPATPATPTDPPTPTDPATPATMAAPATPAASATPAAPPTPLPPPTGRNAPPEGR